MMAVNMRYIHQNRWGYWVRIAQKSKNPVDVSFPYTKYKDPVKALKAAVRFRNEECKRRGLPLTGPMLRQFKQANAYSQSGVLGVVFEFELTPRFKCYWITYIYKNAGAVRVKKTFSCLKYGYEEAFRMAWRTRKRLEGKTRVGTPPPAPKPSRQVVSELKRRLKEKPLD